MPCPNCGEENPVYWTEPNAAGVSIVHCGCLSDEEEITWERDLAWERGNEIVVDTRAGEK